MQLDIRVFTIEIMNRLNAADGTGFSADQQRFGGRHIAFTGDTVQQIAQVDSTYFLGSRDWVGVEVPAHCSALGKVLYAARVLRVPTGALEQVTDATISTGAALNAALPGIRDLGYAITVDELELGLTGIAAPVSRDGIVIAALGLSGPTSRLADHLQATGAVVAAHARALSARLSMHDKEGAA